MTVKYSAPPISGLALAVIFEPLREFKIPHFGLFWSEIQKEFCHCDHGAPIPRFVKSSSDDDESFLLPQCILSSQNYEFSVRIQTDAFHFRWDKNSKSQSYPSFENIYKRFETNLAIFQSFLKKHSIGHIKAQEYSLEYENEIELTESLKDITNIDVAVVEWQWGRKAAGSIPKPTAVYWQSIYNLGDEVGHLHVSTRNGVRSVDKAEVIFMELNASSGKNADPALGNLQSWFSDAHLKSGSAFNELTNFEFQTSVWGREK